MSGPETLKGFFSACIFASSKNSVCQSNIFPSWFSTHTYRRIPISFWLKNVKRNARLARAGLHCTCPHPCVLREVVIRSVCGAWAKAVRDRRLNISRRVTILPLSPTPPPKLHVCLFTGEKYNGNDPPPITPRKGEKPSTRIFFKIVRQKQQNWNSQSMDGYKKLVSNKADLREYVKRKTWFIPHILVPRLWHHEKYFTSYYSHCSPDQNSLW